MKKLRSRRRLVGPSGPRLGTTRSPRSLSEKQYSKRYASLVECKDVNNSTTTSRVL